MAALTHDEAIARGALLDVHHYAVDLDLTSEGETFGSRTAIRFTARADGDTFVEIKPAVLHAVSLDGQALDPAALADDRLPLSLSAGEHELRVDATMSYSHTGEGMHLFTDPVDGETYVYSTAFLDDAPRVFAAFDQPDLKAVFDVTVKARDGWNVIANSVTEHTGEGLWRAATTPRISTYLVIVAAGPWHAATVEHRGLPFGIHCRRSLAPYLDVDADEILTITRQCFDLYTEKFDEPYPFDSYDQVFVPEFNAGAMENPGVVTIREEYVFRSAVTDTERQIRAMTISHEMAHMWFGDLVTLSWWDDIWLNESFAEYMGYQILAEATRFTDTWVEFAVARKGWGYDADQRVSTHPVAPPPGVVHDTASALNNFDGISYAKGASALRQLVAWLGEENFLAGINTHFTRHRFGNATLADFVDSLAANTDRDVRGWADVWLRTTGVDTLTPALQADGSLLVEQDGSRPHHIAAGLYDASGQPQRIVGIDVPQEAPLPLDEPPALVVLNDGDLSYVKIRFDPGSLTAVRDNLSALPSPLTRAVVWNALRDLVRDGELAPDVYLDAVRTHLPHETDLAIIQGVLRFATAQIADRFIAPDRRPAALATLSGLAGDLLRDATDPELRLVAARTFIDSANAPDTIAEWLAAGTVPGGPELDPELRWQLLLRLAVLGATDEEAIAAELERDPSSVGEQGATRCRAAMPTKEAKEHAWEAMFGPEELSNYLFLATAQGFWQPEQADLTSPYVARYFTEAVAVATRRGPAIADTLGRYVFPVAAVDPETARLTEACLKDADLTPTLRRQLVDRLDDLRRALRVRS